MVMFGQKVCEKYDVCKENFGQVAEGISWGAAIDFQIINFTRPEGGRRISYTSTTDNTVKLII